MIGNDEGQEKLHILYADGILQLLSNFQTTCRKVSALYIKSLKRLDTRFMRNTD